MVVLNARSGGARLEVTPPVILRQPLQLFQIMQTLFCRQQPHVPTNKPELPPKKSTEKIVNGAPSFGLLEVAVKLRIGRSQQIQQHQHVDAMQICDFLVGRSGDEPVFAVLVGEVLGAVDGIIGAPLQECFLAIKEHQLEAEVGPSADLFQFVLHHRDQVQHHRARHSRVCCTCKRADDETEIR